MAESEQPQDDGAARLSPLEDPIVPLEEFACRAGVIGRGEDSQWLAVEGVVVAAILEFLADAVDQS
jgi:hypothetical protein